MTTQVRSLADVAEELRSLQYQANLMYNEAGPNLDFSLVKSVNGTTQDKIAHWQQLQLRMTDVGAEHDRLKRIEAEMKAAAAQYNLGAQPVNAPPLDTGGSQRPFVISADGAIRKLLDNSPEFKVLRERGRGSAQIELPEGVNYKTLVTLDNISPQNDRISPVRMRMETRTVIDMIGTSQASSSTIEWYEETTFTNAAAEVTEGSAKAEGALDWTLRTTPIQVIAVWIPVTTQALSDNAFLESEIRNRLLLMVQRREEAEVLVGDGTAPNISGILDNAGIQTEAVGANPVPTAIFNALQKVRGSAGSGFMEPDGIVMHPADFTAMYTLQTLDGNYLMQAILQNAPDMRLWGLPVRQTTAITENTALVGAFAEAAEVYRRGPIVIKASTEHASYFIENKVAILAESRIGLAIPIPTGFCSVTGV